MELPESYLSRMRDLLQDDFDDYLQSFAQDRILSLRVNTNKISAEEFQRTAPFHLTPVPWSPSGFYYAREDHVSVHPYWHAGLCYLQEASAMIPAEILPVGEHDLVLDACCAPGGKSLGLACRMHDHGLLISNDISASRQNATLKNIQRFGISNALVTASDLNDMARKYPGTFDRILLDVPCSGEGMFRRDPSLIKSWMEKGPSDYAVIQKEIAANALTMLKDGGMMVYSTCTFSPEEDEEVILYLKEICPQLEIIRPDIQYEGFMPGILPGTENCIRLYPHKLNGEGHFACLMRKNGTSVSRSFPSVRTSRIKCAGFDEFLKLVRIDFDPSRLMLNKDRILYLPEIPLDSAPLRVVRSGLLMGTIKSDRFEPSQHLAQYLMADRFAQSICLEPDDPNVDKYLRGETISVDSSFDGWVLICTGSYPLGFGKIKNGTVKNRIEPGSRKL